MVMWIVLGSLIGVVVIFLVVTSTLDRKKKKKTGLAKAELLKEASSAGKNISDKVNNVIKENEKTLKNFVPSVGDIKMSDINNKAKNSLKEIKSSRDFKLLTHDEFVAAKFELNIKVLIKEKSNNWAKRNKAEIKFFKEYKPAVKKVAPVTKKRKKK